MTYEVYSAGDSIGEFGVFQDAIECAEDEMMNLWADENGDAELVQVHLICSSTGLYDRGSKDKDGNTTLDYEHHTTAEWDRIQAILKTMEEEVREKPDWLALPWVSEDSVDCFDDGQKLLVAIRNECKWQYEFVVAVHDFEGMTSFEFRDGTHFDWEGVRYLIPLNDLEHTLPAMTG